LNKAAATILGYDSPEELVGIPAVELYLDPEDREAMFKEIMERGYVERYELTLKKKDGSPIHILGSILTRKDPEGNRLQTEAFFMDITERKTREEEMKRRLMRFRLDDGNLYLVKESYPALSLEAFKDLLNVGYQGLVISRTHEEEFKKNVNDSFEFRWLAERGGEKSLSPKVEKIENSLEKSLKKSVILLDNLDYLILKNGFKKTLFFIQHLRELTYINHNIVIMSVDPATLSAREIRLLEKESREIAPRVFVKLPEGLLEILRFIYEHNTQGSKPNYTDIRQELSISKPTVGKRIKILVNTGYLTENVRGSSKVLELTHKGIILFMK
jgi:PAS domain S-box-containing protein